MSYFLKQSTAVTIKFGPFLDETDGKTAETGLTISQADIRLSKNGGNIAQTNNATGATHDELGFYDIPLDTTDTNTLGSLMVAVHESGALPVFQYFMVVPSNVYDSLFSTDYLQVDAVQVEGSDATDQINAACDTALSDYDAPTKAEMDSGLAALNDLSAAEVNAEVDTALADIKLDHLVAVADADDPVNDSIVAKLAASDGDWSGYDKSTDSLEAIADSGGGGPTAEQIADAVLDEALSGHTSAGTLGKAVADIEADTNELQTDDVPGLLSALNDLSAAEVNAEVDTALADYDAPTKAEMDSGLAGLNDLSAAEVNAEVDTALADYDAPTKAELDTAESNLTTEIDANETKIDAITAKMPTNYVMGSSVQTDKDDEIDAIKAKTDNLPTDPASETNVDANETKIDTLDTVADAIKAVTDNLPNSGALSDLATILVDTAELQTDWTDGGRLDTILDTIESGVGGSANFPAGAIEFTYTVDDGVDPLEGVEVWCSTDEGGSNIVWKGVTDAFGVARDVNNNKPQLDAGTYYFRCQKSGYSFTVDSETVS